MTELGEVISTAPLVEQSGPVALDGCPREIGLGLACLVGSFPCLCEQVASWEVETLKNNEGAPRAVVLSLGLVPNIHDPATVMDSLRLTGYVPDLSASRTAIVATFHLTKPVNAGLWTFVQDAGL
jgi:hypothetical protein